MVHVKQKYEGDCGVACLAMACGETYESIEQNLCQHFKREIPIHGMTDFEVGTFAEWLGFKVDYTEFFTLDKPQIFAVKSLNYDNKTHFIYYDGASLYDPQEGTGKKFYSRNDIPLLQTSFVFGTIIEKINRRDYGEEYDDRVSAGAEETTACNT